MSAISHTAAFKNQKDFAPESKIKVGENIWSEGTAGARLYDLVLSQKPSTIQKVIDLAAELKESPFTPKATMGHLRWLFTGGQLEVDGKSYIVPAKEPKAPTVPKAKPEPKGKFKPKVKAAATHQHRMVRTKKLKRAA